ncbi:MULTISPECIES: DUF6879 family protein [Streptomyces]|uniref:DUF6879 domain-containing protein n=1 Tax=Streptomyces sudanensis TaxID=436397 RepID=A0ABY4TEI7_9ACTN|nr:MULTISPECIES: DUF6879 family protein [Streptomyces]MCP9958452.1 hypothetical protein [Streptomyces sudanensis]MCQ0001034.1 hypothetical protein [Streptomyces sudanensis]URN16625.1 hypothetical protein MW084_12500 [Streptomyces sudanensis]
MELISSAERNRLFESFAQDAFHLELRDDYSVPDEDGPYASWLRGEVDNSYMEPWTRMVRKVTGEGKTVRRVRVVTEPHSTYIRWEHATTPINEEAGESIRWVPRHRLPGGLHFPVDGNDWWLFDDSILAVGHFDEHGRVLGSELIEAPEIVAECVRVRDLLWAYATPHGEYTP